jgi:RNA polymerase sigma-70 factor (ECF subfamily)
MSESSPSIPVRELLEHSTWVRDLARRLARDPVAADDLAQSTWLAALEHPPTGDRPVRQWLGAVVRNFALQSRRGESRRADREERAARSAHVPSTAHMLERASMQRQVVKVVMQLDEPYRTTILLRFFEELPPREIARRLDVPVETVRTRVGRGLAKLRAVLDDEYGGDGRAWLAALLPLTERPWGALPTAVGAAAMNAKLIVSAVAVSALGVGAWLTLDSDAAPAAPAPSVAPESAEVTALDAPLETEAASEARTLIVAAAEPAPVDVPTAPVAPAATGLVRGLVLDASGRGLAGVAIEFGVRANDQLTTERATSVGGGQFEFETEAERGSLRAVDEHVANVFSSYYRHDQQNAPVVVVAPRIGLAGRVVDERGEALEGARVSIDLPDDFRTRFDVVLDDSRVIEWRETTDAEGRFTLLEAAFVEGATLRVALEGFTPHTAPLSERSDTSIYVTLARPAADLGGADEMVRGVVLDGGGTPVEGARVALGVDTTVTDAAGAFAFLLDDPKSFGARMGFPAEALTAIKPGLLPARWAAPLEDGEPRWPGHVTLVLEGETFTLAGRVVDHRGDPIPETRVWVTDTTLFGAVEGRPAQLENLLAESEDPFWYFVTADDQGRFRIEGLTDHDYSVRAMDTETMLMAEAGPFAAGAQDVEIALPTDEIYPLVAGHVFSHAGDPIANASVFPMCDAHRARANGQVIGTRHMTREGVVTNGEGYFELRNVPRSLVYLRIEGESILPLEYGRDHDENDARFAGRPRGLPEREIEDMEIAVEQRCHLVVELSDPTAADQLGVLTAEGRPLTINIMTATGRRDGPRLPITGGRSATMAVPDIGATLVLYLAGEEVGRAPIRLQPGEVTNVTF